MSICIPTYNRCDYICQTIESALGQTFKDYEIIILDDGSNDGTGELIKQKAYPVRYYWQENAGIARTRNSLIELSEGQYISFIDSDDLLLSDALDRLYNAILKEGGDVISYGSYCRIDSDGNEAGRDKRKLYSGFISEKLFSNIIVHTGGSMWPKSVFAKIGNYDTSLSNCEDLLLELNASLEFKFIALQEPVFLRRRHPGNLSGLSGKSVRSELEVLERFYYQQGGKERVSQAVAIKRFAKQYYRLGRIILAENGPADALKYFSESVKMKPAIKPAAWWLKALIQKYLNIRRNDKILNSKSDSAQAHR